MSPAERFCVALGCLRSEGLTAPQALHRVHSLLDAVSLSPRFDLGDMLVQIAAVALAGAQSAEREPAA